MRVAPAEQRVSWDNGVPEGERGFSLVELMVTLAVAVVVIAIAIPSFRNLTLSNLLTTAAGDIAVAINAARMEAIKNNGAVQFCGDTLAINTRDALGTKCDTSAGAVIGLRTLADGTREPIPLRDAIPNIVAPLRLKGGLQALRFNGQGLGFAVGATAPFSDTVADICVDGISRDNHRVIRMVGGSVLRTDTASGACSS